MVVTGDFQHESGYRACQHLLQLGVPPTAIFACNDLMAVGSLCAIHEAGLRVGDLVEEVDGKEIRSLDDYEKAIDEARGRGDKPVLFLLRREGLSRYVAVKPRED